MRFAIASSISAGQTFRELVEMMVAADLARVGGRLAVPDAR